MKLLLKKLIPGLLLFGLLTAPAFGQSRMATVDLRKLFDNYWKTKQADAALKERAGELDKSHKDMLDDWKKAKDDYAKLLADANDGAVSSEEKDRRKKAAEDKLKDIKDLEDNIKQFELQARTSLDEQRRRMRENILGEIRTALNAKAKAGNFAMVVDVAAQTINETPVILFSAGENDLTDGVLSQLNAGAPVELPKSDDKGPKVMDEKPSEKLFDKGTTDKTAPKKP